MARESALQSVDLASIPMSSHIEHFKICIHGFLLGTQQKRDNVEKPASSLVAPSDKVLYVADMW